MHHRHLRCDGFNAGQDTRNRYAHPERIRCGLRPSPDLRRRLQRRDRTNLIPNRIGRLQEHRGAAGRPTSGQRKFRRPPDGFEHANQLVAHIQNTEPTDAPFGVAVAGYPEKHLEAESFETDLLNLKRKVDAGADLVVTQLFYDNDSFFRFKDNATSAGITVPIVPGLMPIQSSGQIQRITSMCGASIPDDLQRRLDDTLDAVSI
ncbi:MAG: hypothetical protein CME26_08130 [Gemmatimonadetes bacterium]|nr:hypothetical protein [Gemmatimonadota bacterium]